MTPSWYTYLASRQSAILGDYSNNDRYIKVVVEIAGGGRIVWVSLNESFVVEYSLFHPFVFDF